MNDPVISEIDARRLLKNGVIDLHGRVGDTPIVIERIVQGGYEAFVDDGGWPPRKVGVFKWGEFEVTRAELIVWDEAMTQEEMERRLEMWKVLNSPERPDESYGDAREDEDGSSRT